MQIMEIYIMQICFMQIYNMQIYNMQIYNMQIYNLFTKYCIVVLTSECWNLHLHLREPEKILWQPDPHT